MFRGAIIGLSLKLLKYSLTYAICPITVVAAVEKVLSSEEAEDPSFSNSANYVYKLTTKTREFCSMRALRASEVYSISGPTISETSTASLAEFKFISSFISPVFDSTN